LLGSDVVHIKHKHTQPTYQILVLRKPSASRQFLHITLRCSVCVQNHGSCVVCTCNE